MPANDNKDDDHHADLRVISTLPPPTSTAVHFSPSPSPSSPPSPPLWKTSPKFLTLLLQAIVMTFVVSLFLLFIGVAAVALLHIFVVGGTLRRHRFRRLPSQSSSDAAASAALYSYEDLQRFLPRVECVGGLAGRDDECSICLEPFNEGDWCRNLPVCCHLFHESCVDNWLIKVRNCPICRAPVRLYSEAKTSVISDDDCEPFWNVRV